MRLLINIPKEFEQHFQADRFEDSLHRLSADAHLLAGNYEQETAKMLRNALKSAVIVQPHGRLIDADAALKNIKPIKPEDRQNACTIETTKRLMMSLINGAPTVIPASEEG